MSFWVLPPSGIPVSRTSVQRLTLIEKTTTNIKECMSLYTNTINNKFKEERSVTEPNKKTDIDYWSEFKDGKAFTGIPESIYVRGNYRGG